MSAAASLDASARTPTRRERYGLLLIAISISFWVQGVASPGRWEQVFVSILLGVTLLLALWAGGVKPWVMRVSAAIVAIVIVLSLLEALAGTVNGGAIRAANALLVALAPPAVIVGVVRSLRTREAVTVEAVFGVLCVYILLGMLFSFVYGSIDRLGGHPFFAGGQAATVSECLYFSFTCLTTIGFGDLTARTDLGHTLSVFEGLLGQIYLVTVVSLIVANLGRARPAAR
ncbi:MAG TPA: potassium channel family protein [Solirubrobacteraceae bacterium]|nr:potassium channel family protein [Solirubrobacteraceae bacterium]